MHAYMCNTTPRSTDMKGVRGVVFVDDYYKYRDSL